MFIHNFPFSLTPTPLPTWERGFESPRLAKERGWGEV